MPRTPNDTDTILAALQALAVVMPPNTVLGAAGGSNTVLVDNDDALKLRTVKWPALLIETQGDNAAERVDWRTWRVSQVTARCTYMDRWDQQTATLGTIWASITADLLRMKANVEDNPLLNATVGGTPGLWAEGVKRFRLSGYRDQVVDSNRYGVPLLQRMLYITLILPPYTSAL